MNVLNQSAFLRALGWSLLDSLWQMGALWIMYLLIAGLSQKFQPRQKHAIGLLSMIAGTCWFIVDIILNYYKELKSPLLVFSTADNFALALRGNTWSQLLERAIPYLSCLYLLAILYLFGRFYAQYRFTRRMTNGARHKLNGTLRIFVQTLAQRMGIKKEVKAWISDFVDTPLTIGFWKPVILLPVAVLNQLSLKQAETIILHELQHIKRSDFLVNILIAFSDILLFFNPFARLFSEMLKKERELSCDDLVLQFRYQPAEYAQALLILEKNRSHAAQLAMAATGQNRKMLLYRVKRMLNKEIAPAPVNFRMLGFLLAMLVTGSFSWLHPGNIIVKKIYTSVNPVASPATREIAMGFSVAALQPALKEPVQPQREKRINKDATKPIEIEYQANESVMEDQEEPASVTVQPDEGSQSYYFPSSGSPVTVSYVSGTKASDYSMLESEANNAVKTDISQPYLPSRSFSYQVVEDTSKPKVYILNQEQAQAKVDLEKALKALEMVDWIAVRRELNGKEADLVALQKAIKKAMEQVNWQKVNKEVEQDLKDVEADIRNVHLAQMMQYEQLKRLQQVKEEEFRQNLVRERLMQTSPTPSRGTNQSSGEKQKPKVKVRKIVVI